MMHYASSRALIFNYPHRESPLCIMSMSTAVFSERFLLIASIFPTITYINIYIYIVCVYICLIYLFYRAQIYIYKYVCTNICICIYIFIYVYIIYMFDIFVLQDTDSSQRKHSTYVPPTAKGKHKTCLLPTYIIKQMRKIEEDNVFTALETILKFRLVNLRFLLRF